MKHRCVALAKKPDTVRVIPTTCVLRRHALVQAHILILQVLDTIDRWLSMIFTLCGHFNVSMQMLVE
jgi:hypothetical protein